MKLIPDSIEESGMDIFDHVREAIFAANREGIKANSIVINKNLVKVPEKFGCYPEMICGLKCYSTSNELPEDYVFAVLHDPGRRKTNADSICANEHELATMLHAVKLGYAPWCDYHCKNEGDDGCDKCIEKWLQQPAEVDHG